MPADNLSQVTDSTFAPIALRCAQLADAAAVCQLVSDSGTLDPNSRYCYLLLCRDFAETCVVAQQNDTLVGFVTAYRPPQRPEALFVWQIAIAPAARRQGLGLRMLEHLLSLPGSTGVRYMEATVTPSNGASRRLFHKLAERLRVSCHVEPGFTAELLGGGHEEEELFRIGPL